MTTQRNYQAICSLGVLLSMLAGCKAADRPSSAPNLLETAAAQATAIVQKAEATALILKAQSQATGLVKNAEYPTPSPVQETLANRPTELPSQPGTPAATAPLLVGLTDESKVEIIRVSFAGEGAYIYVEFMAPPKIAQTWWQGSVSVVDEATGTVYEEIPVAPIIGPLIGKPNHAGQLGYIMLVNAPTPLQVGSLVTVTLGGYKFEHIPVQKE
jgi:hypothetical protein